MIFRDKTKSLEENVVIALDQLKDEREPRESVFQDIINYILPELEDYLRETQWGKRVDVDRYSSIGLISLQRFVDGLFGYLVSPSLSWFRMTMEDYRLQEVPEIRMWTQDLTDHFRWRFKNTNFYECIPIMFEYAGALGYGSIFTERDYEKNDIVNANFHPGEIYIQENKYREVDTVFREMKMKGHIVLSKFGEKSLPDNVVMNINANPQEKLDVIHATYPRKDYDPSKIDPKNKPYASVWVLENPRHLIREGGYNENPHHVWRYKLGTTAYGTGPAEDALIECSQDNEIMRTLLGAAQRSVEPSVSAPSEMEGFVDLTPHGISYYKDPTRRVFANNTGINYPVGKDIIDRVRGIIEKHFKIEFFLLLSQQDGVQPRTATEIMELQGEKAAVLARPISRLEKDVLNPIFDRYFNIDFEMGILPPPPDILFEVGGKLAVNYIGPLAQIQKQAIESQGIRAGLEYLGAVAQMYPSALDSVDPDKLTVSGLRTYGFPEDTIRTPEQLKKIRMARQKVEMQESQMEAEAQKAKIAKDYAQADRATGNKMSDMVAENA